MKIKITLFFAILSNLLFAQTTEAFEGTVVPATWVNSGCFTTTNNFCGGARSCAFNGVGDFVITPLIVSGTTISFDYKRSGNTTAWSLEVESAASTSGPWTSVGTVSSATTTCQNASFSIPANVYIRFRDARAAGTHERYIDNITVQDNSLPVTLTSFEVSDREKSILLSFSTATERNNAHFEIERSADGRTFEKIGQVAGNGNSTAVIYYTFEDKAPWSGINYYRLRQVDLDGESTYSPVRSIVFGDTKNVVLFPTPVSETMTVQLDEAYNSDAQWQIMDITGRILSEGIFAAEQNTFTIPVHTLTEGTYVLRMIANQTAITKQFRKL